MDNLEITFDASGYSQKTITFNLLQPAHLLQKLSEYSKQSAQGSPYKNKGYFLFSISTSVNTFNDLVSFDESFSGLIQGSSGADSDFFCDSSKNQYLVENLNYNSITGSSVPRFVCVSCLPFFKFDSNKRQCVSTCNSTQIYDPIALQCVELNEERKCRDLIDKSSSSNLYSSETPIFWNAKTQKCEIQTLILNNTDPTSNTNENSGSTTQEVQQSLSPSEILIQNILKIQQEVASNISAANFDPYTTKNPHLKQEISKGNIQFARCLNGYLDPTKKYRCICENGWTHDFSAAGMYCSVPISSQYLTARSISASSSQITASQNPFSDSSSNSDVGSLVGLQFNVNYLWRLIVWIISQISYEINVNFYRSWPFFLIGAIVVCVLLLVCVCGLVVCMPLLLVGGSPFCAMCCPCCSGLSGIIIGMPQFVTTFVLECCGFCVKKEKVKILAKVFEMKLKFPKQKKKDILAESSSEETSGSEEKEKNNGNVFSKFAKKFVKENKYEVESESEDDDEDDSDFDENDDENDDFQSFNQKFFDQHEIEMDEFGASDSS